MEFNGSMDAMESPGNRGDAPGFVALAISNGTFKRSVQTGVVVGTILTAINQGDVIVAGDAPNLIKVVLNYLVPYCVATYGAVTAKQYALRRRGE